MKQREKKAFRKTSVIHFFLYALSGVLTALPLVFEGLWPLGWLSMIYVLYHEFTREAGTYKGAYLRGLCFFYFYTFVVFSWFFSLYPMDFIGFDPQSALIVVLLAAFGIPLLQSIASALSFIFAELVRKRLSPSVRPFILCLLISVLFPLCEYLHTLTWLGVPFARLAAGQVGCLSLIQSASLFGSYFITFIIVLFQGLLSVAIINLRKKNARRAILCATLSAIVFIANLTFGTVKIQTFSPEGERVSVSAIQGNIRFEDKWANKAYHTMEVYEGLCEKAKSEGADLIVMPETALPYDVTEDEAFRTYFEGLSEGSASEIIVTAFESEKGELYNTARLSSDGSLSESVYKKRHLVPFGEYTPMLSFIQRVFPPLADISPIEDPLTAGDGAHLIDCKNGKVGCLICFDSIYEGLCRESTLSGATIIALSTNDSWFEGSSALYQHLSHARLRAVENGRYVIRSANTGISAVISPTGEILASLLEDTEGIATAKAFHMESTTLYTKTGDIALILFALCAISLCVFATTYKKKREK